MTGKFLNHGWEWVTRSDSTSWVSHWHATDHNTSNSDLWDWVCLTLMNSWRRETYSPQSKLKFSMKLNRSGDLFCTGFHTTWSQTILCYQLLTQRKEIQRKLFIDRKFQALEASCWNLLEVVLMNNAFGYLGHSVRCKHAVWLVVWSGDERVLTLREQYRRQIVLGGEYWGGVVMNNVGRATSHARPGVRSFVRMWNNVDQDAFSQLQQQ